MKGNVQILLLVALLVSSAAAAEEEETMEERKLRIARKYLRERMDITYSDEVVPEEQTTAAEILASDGLEEAEVDIERQEPGTVMPPPMRIPPPRLANSNWLLSETTDAEDPYADPYTRKEEEQEQSDWSGWDAERDYSSYFSSERDTSFNWRSDAASREQADPYDTSRRNRAYDPRSPFTQQSSDGFQQQGGAGVLPGSAVPSRPNAFNSGFSQSGASTAYPRQSEIWTGPLPETDRQRSGGSFNSNPYPTQQEQQTQQGAYSPYANPYQNQYRQRQNQQNGYRDPNEEYRRQDPFEQWKRYQPRPFDPTEDNAYVEEMMPGTRR